MTSAIQFEVLYVQIIYLNHFQILKPSNTTVIKAIKPHRIHKPRARNKDIKNFLKFESL